MKLLPRMKFFNRKNKELDRRLNAYDEVNHAEDQKLRNAQDNLLERINTDKSIDIARYHAVRREINDD